MTRLDPSRPFDRPDRVIFMGAVHQPSPLRRVRSRAAMMAFAALACAGVGFFAAAWVMG
jgi:hypothetical protein